MKRTVVRALFTDNVATSSALMRARYKLAVRASQRRPENGTGKTLGWSDSFTVTPLHMVVLN